MLHKAGNGSLHAFPTRLLSFAGNCFFVGRNCVRAGPACAICPTGANSQSEQFAGRPAAASGSGLAGGHAGIARRIRIQRIRNGRVPARHQRGSQSAAQCAAPFPSTPARSALNQSDDLGRKRRPPKGGKRIKSRHPRSDRYHGFSESSPRSSRHARLQGRREPESDLEAPAA